MNNAARRLDTRVAVRAEGVETRTVGHELVAYDPATTATHVLDPAAAALFDAVDGTRSIDALTQHASLTLGTPITTKQTHAALADLVDAGLIHIPTEAIGRRSLLVGSAIAGATAVPTVLSVIAPSPAAAMSDDTGGGTSGGGGTDGGTDGGVASTSTTVPPPPKPVGNVTTLAGSGAPGWADGNNTNAKFDSPIGVAIDPDGTIYVADHSNNRIRAMTPAGTVTTLAGSGTAGWADGTGVNARFGAPYGLAIGPSGTVYVSDHVNHRIRAINPINRVVTTLAGSGSPGSANGIGTSAHFASPAGLAVDPNGTIYVADYSNSQIRAINPTTRAVTTLAGSRAEGWVDGTGTGAQFNYPAGLAIGPDGTLYVADMYNHRIRAINPATGAVTTLAGSGSPGSANGAGTSAQFNFPTGLAVGPNGAIYVADMSNNLVRAINPTTGAVTTLAGSGTADWADGTGASAQFNYPTGLTAGPNDTLYVADMSNHRIRKIT